jgi:hypothetical protein
MELGGNFAAGADGVCGVKQLGLNTSRGFSAGIFDGQNWRDDLVR